MRILFIDNSTKLKTVRDLETRARGGMITSLFRVSDYLSTRGHDVTVFSDIESTGATRNGVKWLNEFWGEYDVLVTNRGVGSGYSDVRAKRRILWTHDLPHMGFAPEPKTLHSFDRVVFMSRYAEKVWRAFYKTIGRSVFIPNGVDKDLFYPREKNLDYLIYVSAPNRGLDKLAFIFDCVRERLGRDLFMNAYSNMSVLHPNEAEYEIDYESVSEKFKILDPIPQQKLARHLGRASLMIMPTGYPEICSNSILQSLASGTPIITTGNLGSAGEWIKHKRNGMLTGFSSNDYMVYVVEMIRNAIYALQNEKRHRRMIRNAGKTNILSWNQVGAKWERMLKR